jgi:anti-sigma regulatory factor (Ser/Thr protein kinase)
LGEGEGLGAGSARPAVADEPIELRTTSDTANVSAIRSAVKRAAAKMGFCDDDVSAIALAVDEAVANVIRHGYNGRGGQPIEVSLKTLHGSGKQGLQILIADRGCQVEPSSITGRDLNDIRPGGLGTHIMRAVMDEVAYEQRDGGGMRVRLVKWVGGDGAARSAPEDGGT